jgi:hypothetical protein
MSPDNAAYEGFFGRLKTELFYPRQRRSTPSNSSFSQSIPTSAGTTKSGSTSPLAPSALANTVRASELQRNPVQHFRRTPSISVLLRR